ncbi:probable E3 ubiquitin-protein ligase LIN-2 [Coccomyxa sp. Obi]|nr:probable E3 ubiquitin-protein ligase LIN-2 [Coccomyxa sp. Obi]
MLTGNSPPFYRNPEMDTPLRKSAKEVYTMGALFPGSPVGVQAPSSFFDPLTGRLMTEPVKLINTNETFDRTSVQTWYRRSMKDVEPKCPRTGQPLKGWIVIQADDELRKRIVAWADKHKCNLDLISKINASQKRNAAQAPPSYLSACRGCKVGAHPAGLLVDPR